MQMTLCLVLAVVLTASYTEGSLSIAKMVQAACSAKATTHDRIWAMPRNCHGDTRTCGQVCSDSGRTCFQTFHVYGDSSMFNYVQVSNGCDVPGGACGPNYCCCRGPCCG